MGVEMAQLGKGLPNKYDEDMNSDPHNTPKKHHIQKIIPALERQRQVYP